MKKKSLFLLLTLATSAMLISSCTKYKSCHCVEYDHYSARFGGWPYQVDEFDANVLEDESCSRLNMNFPDGFVSCSSNN